METRGRSSDHHREMTKSRPFGQRGIHAAGEFLSGLEASRLASEEAIHKVRFIVRRLKPNRLGKKSSNRRLVSVIS